MNLSIQQKQKLIKTFPELGNFFEQQETRNLLNGIKSQSDEQFKQFLTLLTGRIDVLKGEKGDKGDKPVKGVDYWTENELNNFARYILNVSTPVKGKHYFDGKDYVLTKEDKKEIAQSITVPVIEKIIEKRETIKEVLPKLDVSMVEGAVSKKEVLDGMVKIDGRIKAVDMRWRGGGIQNINGLVQAGTNVTISGSGTKSDPYIVNSTGGGSSGFQQPTSGVINGVNQTFVWATAPNAIVVDEGRVIQKVSSDGTINWTGTTTTVLSIAPNNDIFAVA